MQELQIPVAVLSALNQIFTAGELDFTTPPVFDATIKTMSLEEMPGNLSAAFFKHVMRGNDGDNPGEFIAGHLDTCKDPQATHCVVSADMQEDIFEFLHCSIYGCIAAVRGEDECFTANGSTWVEEKFEYTKPDADPVKEYGDR